MPTMMEGHVLFVALHTLSVSPRHIRALHCEPSSFLIKSFSRVHFLSQSLHRNLFRLYGSLVAVVQKTKSSQTYIPKKIIVLNYLPSCSIYRSSCCCQSSTLFQSMPSLTVKKKSSIHSLNFKLLSKMYN